MEKDLGSSIIKLMVVLAGCSMLVLVLVALSGVNTTTSFDGLDSSKQALNEPPKDRLLGGLLTDAFDESSCLSRYEAAQYWKVTNLKPSPYLVQRLRRYEALHKKCGPNTELYNKAVEQLKANRTMGHMECNYVVWIPEAGLGNRITSLISTFLYALLSDRVMLVKLVDDYRDLFCEPFPETSWILPDDFPIADFGRFYIQAPQSYGNLLRNKVVSMNMGAANPELPPYIYIHIMHDYTDMDKMFFCDGAQSLVQRVPWVLLRANLYFGPGLFLPSQYHEQLSKLFPSADTVFHHLSRYLLHPANSVWGYITRYYDAYLANAQEIVGVQIRDLPYSPATFDQRIGQVINCTLKEGILPGVNRDTPIARNVTGGRRPKAVLVVSLRFGYYEKIKNMYYEHSTTTGELIAVYQPSHEEEQHTEQRNHNVKALSDIYLLSFSHALVTSAYSTFGYLAQGIGGLRPWIALTPNERNPFCIRAMSMEPCFLNPPTMDCQTERKIDTGAVVPHLKHCEDLGSGLKLFN